MQKKLKVISYMLVILLVASLTIIACEEAEERPFDPNGIDNDIENGYDDNDLYDDRDNVIDEDGNLNDDENNDFNDFNDNIDNRNNNEMNNNEMNNNDNMENNMSRRAENIADKVSTMTNVEDATVIITNNTALIGVDLLDTDDPKVNSDVKNEIERKVKNIDNRINNVVVTAEADTFDRIKGMGMSIREGRPVSGFANEVEDIIRRITPNM